jgi:hypothetical protein
LQKKISKSTILHPILFAAFPVLFLYSQGNNILSFSSFVIPLVLSISVTLIIWLALRLIIKNKTKSALLTTMFVSLSLNIGHLRNLKVGFEISDVQLVLVFIFLIIAISIFLIKTKRKLDNATAIINTVAVVLVLLVLIDIGTYNFEKLNYEESFNFVPNSNLGITEKFGSPDVYVLVLDAHANHLVLEKFFDYENKDFVESLKKKGFFVPENYTNTNYPNTELTISSMLNMNYLHNLVPDDVSDKYKIELVNKLSDNNNVMKNFKDLGYTTIGLDSGWVGARVVNIADENFCDHSKQNARVMFLLHENTILGSIDQIRHTNLVYDTGPGILNKLNQVSEDDDKRQKVLCNFAELSNVSEKFEEPIFVYWHIISPHPSWVFDSDGNPPSQIISPTIEDTKKRQSAYLQEMEFVDKKLIEVTDKLILESEVEPIIIILGDHGTRIVDKQNSEEDNFIIKYGNLLAFYLPGEIKPSNYETTPVNIFRLIFNSYYNGDYEILENKVYSNETSEITDWEIKVKNIFG